MDAVTCPAGTTEFDGPAFEFGTSYSPEFWLSLYNDPNHPSPKTFKNEGTAATLDPAALAGAITVLVLGLLFVAAIYAWLCVRCCCKRAYFPTIPRAGGIAALTVMSCLVALAAGALILAVILVDQSTGSGPELQAILNSIDSELNGAARSVELADGVLENIGAGLSNISWNAKWSGTPSAFLMSGTQAQIQDGRDMLASFVEVLADVDPHQYNKTAQTVADTIELVSSLNVALACFYIGSMILLLVLAGLRWSGRTPLATVSGRLTSCCSCVTLYSALYLVSMAVLLAAVTTGGAAVTHQPCQDPHQAVADAELLPSAGILSYLVQCGVDPVVYKCHHPYAANIVEMDEAINAIIDTCNGTIIEFNKINASVTDPVQQQELISGNETAASLLEQGFYLRRIKDALVTDNISCQTYAWMVDWLFGVACNHWARTLVIIAMVYTFLVPVTCLFVVLYELLNDQRYHYQALKRQGEADAQPKKSPAGLPLRRLPPTYY